jgi:hypothetical protein
MQRDTHVGETRVDIQHLLEDLRDAYTGTLEETILTEVIANALDSGATHVHLLTDPANVTLTIVDNGRGMQRRELARYHDLAASTKRRGEGIGFAGVGIKLGLLASREVVTETRRGATHVATRWRLAARHRAPWKWTPPPGLTTSRGTAVQLALANQLSPLLDAGYLEETIRRHFEPLIDPAFSDVLRRHYLHGIVFEVDGRQIAPSSVPGPDRIPIAIRLGRRRTPSVMGFIERGAFVPPDREGVAISTFGKVIKRGWEWLGVVPPVQARVSGALEAPDLAACLTLNKNDFIRSGTRGAAYLAYRKAIQEVVSRQLAEWGDRRDEDAEPRKARLERDLERVLEDLADAFPLLRSLVERRAGGQKRLPLPGRGHEHVPAPLLAMAAGGHEGGERGAGPAPPGGARRPAEEASVSPRPPSPGEPPPVAREGAGENEPSAAGEGQAHLKAAAAGFGTVAGRHRPARYGLLVQFEARPGDSELARLVDNTIWINDAHPAYVRAAASRSLGYHTAVAVALALAPLAVEANGEHSFVTQFLAQWGAADAAKRPARRRPRTRSSGRPGGLTQF